MKKRYWAIGLMMLFVAGCATKQVSTHLDPDWEILPLGDVATNWLSTNAVMLSNTVTCTSNSFYVGINERFAELEGRNLILWIVFGMVFLVYLVGMVYLARLCKGIIRENKKNKRSS